MSGSDITTEVHIAAGIPATFDKVGFEAMTWVEIGGMVSVGEIGVTDNMIDVPDLKTGFTRGVKGARVGTSTALAVRQIPNDPGQVLLKQACFETVEYSLWIKEPDATDEVEYIAGLPHDYKRNPRSTTTYNGFTAAFRTNYESVITTAP